MKNINLLKDTKKADENAIDKQSGGQGFDLSEPERYEFKEHEGKISGGPSWFKRVFGGGPKKQKKEKQKKAAALGAETPTQYVKKEQAVGLPPTAPQSPSMTYGSRTINAPTEPPRPPQPKFSASGIVMSHVKKSMGNQNAVGTPPAPPAPPKTPRQNTPSFGGQVPVSFDVNLLPEDLIDQYEPKKKLVTLAVVSGLTIVGLAALYVAMLFYQSSIVTKTNEVRTESGSINLQIGQYQKERAAALAFKEKIDAISDRLDKHIYWSKFFSLLEKHTVPDVHYNNAFAGDINGQMTLEAVGKDYSSVARQLVAFQQADDFVESVVINSASRNEDAEQGTTSVKFSIQLQLVEDVFMKTSTEGAGQ